MDSTMDEWAWGDISAHGPAVVCAYTPEACAEERSLEKEKILIQFDQIGRESPEAMLSEPEGEEASLSLPVEDVPVLYRRRNRAATECLVADLSEPDPEDTPCGSRQRASTEFCGAVETDISGGDVSSWVDSHGREWEEDWSKIVSQLQPQRFKIGEACGALAARRQRRCSGTGQRLSVRIAVDLTTVVAPRTGLDTKATRARTMSDACLSKRRLSLKGKRARAKTAMDDVYDLDWTKFASPTEP